MTILLIADPLFSKFSHVYILGKKSMEYLTFKHEVELVPVNNSYIKPNLPYDIAEQIIFNLIEDYIKCRQVSHALPLINISRSILKRFYLKYFSSNTVIDRSSVEGYNKRLSSMLNIFRLTDDHFIDLVAFPNGCNEGMMFTIKLYFDGTHYNHGKIYPWGFDGDTEVGTIAPPTIFSFQDKLLENDLVAEIITGPTQYEMLFVKGKALSNGTVKTHYLKSPVIIFQLYHYVAIDTVSPGMFDESSWESFGVLARRFFGPNAGIFIHLTSGIPATHSGNRPVIYEI